MLICWAVSLPLWIIYRLRISSRRRNNGNHVSIKRELLLFICVAYISTVLAITVAPVSLSGITEPVKSAVNFIPVVNSFNYYFSTFADPSGVTTEKALENIIGNLLLFIPLGILLPFISPKFQGVKNTLFTCFICSLFIEFCQLILSYFGTYRTSDIDDIILNTVSGLFGWLIFSKLISPYLHAGNGPAKPAYNQRG